MYRVLYVRIAQSEYLGSVELLCHVSNSPKILCVPIFLTKWHIEGWAQDYGNSNVFLKPLFRGNLDPFVNNANLGAIAHTSNGT